MSVKIELCLIILVSVFISSNWTLEVLDERKLYVELTDENWAQIQTGEWLIGIFHEESEASVALSKDWNTLSFKCKEYGINVALVNAKQNPALQVRFLVKEFPKVFHIKEDVVRVFESATRDELVRVIKDQKWSELDVVSSYLSPLSFQLSAFSFLCAHSLRLYNYEKGVINKYIISPSVDNAVFCLTFVVIGTTLGLLCSCFFQLVKFLIKCCRRVEKVEEMHSENQGVKEKPAQVVPSKLSKNIKKQPVGKLRKRRT